MASNEIEPVKLRRTQNPTVDNHQQWHNQTQFQSQPHSIPQHCDILDHKPVNNQFQSFSKAVVQTPSTPPPKVSSTASNPKPIPVSTGKPDFDFGDSISSGLAGRQGGLGVQTSDARGISQVGANPAQVLTQIQSFDKNKLNGYTVRLSSGISNDPSKLVDVENQIKYLTDNGAKVQLMGVTNNPPSNLPGLVGMNDKLSALANKYKDKGVSFLGGFTPGLDGVHPASYDDLKGSVGIDATFKNPKNFVSKLSLTSNSAPFSSAAPISGGGGGRSIGSGGSVGSSSGASFFGGASLLDDEALENFLINILGLSPEKAKAIIKQFKGQADKSADGLVKAAGLEGQTITKEQATEGIGNSTKSGDLSGTKLDSQALMNTLMKDYGLSKAGAAAVVGNAMLESGLQTGISAAEATGGTSHGLFMFRDGYHFEKLKAFASAKGTDWKDPNTQVGYLIDIIKKDPDKLYGGLLDKLKNGTNVNEITTAFRAQFERAETHADEGRLDWAQKAFNGEHF